MYSFQTLFYLLANVVASITIILLNKWIYFYQIFPNITLSMIHFIVTFGCLFVYERWSYINVKIVQIRQLLLLSFCFCGFVVFANLSLEYNSVGTFQVAKMLTTPGVMLIQIIYYRAHFSLQIKLTILPIVVGVTLCFMYDINFKLIGMFFAILGVFVTSFYQVLVNSKQSELQLDSMQLLYYQAPLSAAFLCVCIPIFEFDALTMHRSWSVLDIILIGCSSLAAVFVNLTTYWIIGNLSPLTYNMLGHSKFVIVTLGGWFLFDEVITLNQWIGMSVTLSGIILYSHFKLKENAQDKISFTSLPVDEIVTKT